MTRILQERNFPVDGFVPLASARSVGRLVSFAGEDHEIRELTPDAARGADIAFVSIGAAASREHLPADRGCRHALHRQLERLPDGARRAAVRPGGQSRGAPRMATSRHHRGPELHHDHRGAPGRPAPSRGRLHLARALQLPGGQRCRLARHARARRTGREARARRRVAEPSGPCFVAARRPLREAHRLQRRRQGGRVRTLGVHRRGGQGDGRDAEDPRRPGPPGGRDHGARSRGDRARGVDHGGVRSTRSRSTKRGRSSPTRPVSV